jgi:nucleotide-binding universal stress UspA family protein
MSNNNSQVVVGYDFSTSGREALYRALALATRAPFHVLHFLCVIDPHLGVPAVPMTGRVDYLYAERVQQQLAEIIAQELRNSAAKEDIHYFVHARIGKPADEILGLAKDVGADLIMVGTKGLTGLEHIVLGSVAEKVVREARCSVEVIRPKTYEFVQLLDVKDVEAERHYIKPHHYSYESAQIQKRPANWPLY